ncbi:flagellar filament outer layer protein Flaa domain protein [Leptospira ryugenii]|uniref:Flagellar filament outer layer protein Flaa domain protein n=1 Tax=Leptospira ryugenii TaxID=1917863 RepID=A0A2P2E1M3_9LEPT|nr:flagellar assembly protein FlaA [Leptospira ryugenii]GBF50781.1 flagellar filament outer layer protein Flaa domain protein [Leptospira ryugenii]
MADLSLSRNITAPIPESRQSLVIRIPKAANYPFAFYFPEPLVLRGFVREIKVPLYSSQSLGNITMIVEDQYFETKQIMVSSLNFRGWKVCSISFAQVMEQNDRIFQRSANMRILGFYYLPNEENAKNQEVLIAIDDISAVVRDKYRPLRDKGILLEE